LLKSPLKGFFAIIPIGATLLLLFGFMGFTGIPLDIATVLVGSISVGIGIDYAIHMITHFEEDYKKTKSIQSALEESIKISGRAIVINVLSVSLGFLILLFSNLVPLQRFGLLVAVTMISSGVATLTLMPVVINLISRRIKIKS
jgi:predicted RND superfamily exporter protein